MLNSASAKTNYSTLLLLPGPVGPLTPGAVNSQSSERSKTGLSSDKMSVGDKLA